MTETSKLIKSILKSRKFIKEKIRKNQMRDQLAQEEIEKFHKPVTKKLKEATQNQIIPAITELNKNQEIFSKTQNKMIDYITSVTEKSQLPSTSVTEKSHSPSTLVTDIDFDKDFDKKILTDFELPMPSAFIKQIKDINERNTKIDEYIQSVNAVIRKYGSKKGAAKTNGDDDELERISSILGQLQAYRDCLATIKQGSRFQIGSGIYCDGNEMVERLQLLCASKQAGNDSKEVYNEMVDILDKLLNLKLISKATHKKIFTIND